MRNFKGIIILMIAIMSFGIVGCGAKEKVKQEPVKMTNEEIRAEMLKVLQGSFDEETTEVKMTVKDGVVMLQIIENGFAKRALLVGPENQEYKKFKEALSKMSKSINEAAKRKGSTEKYSIAMMNDLSPDRAILIYMDGKCLYEE